MPPPLGLSPQQFRQQRELEAYYANIALRQMGTPTPPQGLQLPQPLDPLAEALGTNIPPSVRTALNQLRALHLGERLWHYLAGGDSHGDSIYLLPDNRILRLAPNPNDLRLYIYNPTNRTWTDIGTRGSAVNPFHHLAIEINTGISAIIASRTERNWLPPSVRTLVNRLRLIPHSHENGIYLCPGCRDSLYVLPNGNILNINRNGSTGSVYTSTGWRTLTAAELRGADVQRGIQAIIRSRTARGWTYPGS